MSDGRITFSTALDNKQLAHDIALSAKQIELVFDAAGKIFETGAQYFNQLVQSNEEYQAQVAKLRAALATAFQPLYDAALPICLTILRVLTDIATVAANVFSGLFGKTAKQSADNAKALNKQATAIKGVSTAAKEAKKSLASFDQINRLDDEQSGSSGGGGGGIAGGGGMDFSEIGEELTDTQKKIAEILKGVLLIAAGWKLWKIGSGLPGMLGTIVTKIGKVLVGVGLAIIGFMLLKDGVTSIIEDGPNFTNVLEAIAGVLLLGAAAGLIFAKVVGRLVTGIGLVAVGLLVLWDGISRIIEDGPNFENVMESIAGILLVGAGAALLFGSWIPLAIAAVVSLMLAIASLGGEGELFAQGMKDTIGGIVDIFVAAFNGDIPGVLEGFVRFFKGIGEMLWATAAGIVKTIAGFIEDLLSIGYDESEYEQKLREKGYTNVVTNDERLKGYRINSDDYAKLGYDEDLILKALEFQSLEDKSAFVQAMMEEYRDSDYVSQLLEIFANADIMSPEEEARIMAEELRDVTEDIGKGGVSDDIEEGFKELESFLQDAEKTDGIELSRIEAPEIALGTILPEYAQIMSKQQESLDNLLTEDSMREIMQGSEQSSTRIESLLESLIAAVQNIRVSDDTIGRAASRYMARTDRALGR